MSNQNLFDLSGKRALITGSGSGLGKYLAKALASAGATVILNGRSVSKLEITAAEMKKDGHSVEICPFDITKPSEIDTAVKSLLETTQIDILVNNAGLQIRHPLEEFPESDWDRLIDTNLKGAYLVSKAVVKGMIQNQSGKIINICSVNSELARNTISPYTASKGGLKNLTKGMATEWAKHNIQVNAIGPGYFKTEMTASLWQNREFDQWLCNRTPANRWGNPEELSGPVIFLASSASSYVNGHVLYVEGGMLACV